MTSRVQIPVRGEREREKEVGHVWHLDLSAPMPPTPAHQHSLFLLLWLDSAF